MTEIERAALALVEEARASIEREVVRGRSFDQAREAFLFEHAGSWIAAYGKPCADMAVRGVAALGERRCLTAAGRRAQREAWRAEATARNAHLGRDTWLNRLWVRWFAISLYGLIAVMVLGAEITPADASERRAALADCAEARIDAERQRRRCWRFSTAERGTYRAYDRADSPRDWEKPRAWE